MKEVLVGSYTIVLATDLIDLIYGFRQLKMKSPESGGVLLGQKKDEVIYILRASVPNFKDKFHRTGFIRDKEAAQIIINHEFYNSRKRTIYLGEWHTHPENRPSPSSQDLKMIKEQFKKNDLNENFVILTIVGNLSLFIGILSNEGLQEANIPWSYFKEDL